MRRTIRAAIAALGVVSLSHVAGAQALGPFRQFLAVEPYYEYTRLDNGPGADKSTRHGYGARLWINLDPFHFIPHGSIALFTSYSPKQNEAMDGNATTLNWGAEYDQFLVHRPLGGVIDPFLSVGYSRFRVKSSVGTLSFKESYNGLPVGGGVRIPLPNRFELRGDARDLILFNIPNGTNGAKRTTNNLLLQAGLGITF